MDILFFNPVQTKNGFALYNFTLLWLASYLKNDGLEARIFFLTHEFEKEIRDALITYKPRYVAVSCRWYTNLYGAFIVARMVKSYDSNIKVIAGGNTATYFDRELLSHGDFDIIIRGDAEFPLVQLLKHNRPMNSTIKINDSIKRQRMTYIQSQEELDSYRLECPELIVENHDRVLKGTNYIWVGKGCKFPCFYCGGSRTAQIIISGRKDQIIRPIKNVLSDIKLLTRYSDHIMFDFSDFQNERESYFFNLLNQLPQKRYYSKIFYWGMPSLEFLGRVSDTFKRAEVIVDVVTFNEKLREQLSQRAWTKAFVSNGNIERMCESCLGKGNIEIGLESIAGLPQEKEFNFEETIQFARNLLQKYICVTHISYWPLSLEPASRIFEESEIFNFQNARKTFEDFFELTKTAFENNYIYPYMEYHSAAGSEPQIVNPYGTCEVGSSEEEVYQQSKTFYDSVNNELRANRILFKKV